MLPCTSPVAAAEGAASLCGSFELSLFGWSVLGIVSGAFAGLLLWSGEVAGCWSVLDGDWVEGDVLCGDVAGVLCATAKQLPRTTIIASFPKCCFTIILRCVPNILCSLIQAPRQLIRVPRLSRRSSRSRGRYWRIGN